MASDVETHFEPAYCIGEKIHNSSIPAPTKPGLYAPRSEKDIPQRFRARRDMSYFSRLDFWNRLKLAEIITIESGMTVGLVPPQVAHDRIFCRKSELPDVATHYWIDIDALFRKDKVATRLRINASGGKLDVYGEWHDTNTGFRTVDSLVKPGLMARPDVEFYQGPINFDDNGEASVGSFWAPDAKSFGMSAGRPMYEDAAGIFVSVFLVEEEKKS
ncbi:MAG TPA: hypothetical protein VJH90_00380 [archaeon]|nr:hypothetical protein [archaeon]